MLAPRLLYSGSQSDRAERWVAVSRSHVISSCYYPQHHLMEAFGAFQEQQKKIDT